MDNAVHIFPDPVDAEMGMPFFGGLALTFYYRAAFVKQQDPFLLQIEEGNAARLNQKTAVIQANAQVAARGNLHAQFKGPLAHVLEQAPFVGKRKNFFHNGTPQG
jgi:hypothetical protein